MVHSTCRHQMSHIEPLEGVWLKSTFKLKSENKLKKSYINWYEVVCCWNISLVNAVIVKMTMMSNAGKFPTTNSKIHQRNPSWKSILPKHAKSQTYSAHSEPFRQFRKLCLCRIPKIWQAVNLLLNSAPLFDQQYPDVWSFRNSDRFFSSEANLHV